MDRNNQFYWESYFLTQEILKQKNTPYRRKKRRLTTTLFVLCIGIAAAFFIKPVLSYLSSDYRQVTKEAEIYDFTTISQEMAEYLNTKYGAETVVAADLNAAVWHPYGSGSDPVNTCFMANVIGNPEKIVYAIYQSDYTAVYFDNFQWDEIREALETEMKAAVGLEDVYARPAVLNEGYYNEYYRTSPWIICNAYEAYYAGNLESFFDKEQSLRSKLEGSKAIQKIMQPCGTVAFFFSDPNNMTMKERLKNPQLTYTEAYDTAMKQTEEKYHIDILSCVLPSAYYKDLTAFYMQKSDTMIPQPIAYKDRGEGRTFFYAGYTLLGWAYGQIYQPTALEITEGVFLIPNDGNKKENVYTYETAELPAKTQLAVSENYSDWTTSECFTLYANEGYESDMADNAMAIDFKKLYPGKEIVLIRERSGEEPVVFEKRDDTADITTSGAEYIYERDGYAFVPPFTIRSSQYKSYYTILTK